MNWIEINLPWQYFRPLSNDKEYSRYSIKLSKKAVKEIGSPDKYYSSHFGEINKCYNFYYALRDNNLDKKERKDYESLSVEDFLKKYYPKEGKALIGHIKLRKDFDNFVENQPEYKEYEKKHGEALEKEKQKSFCGRGLNKPGTLIEVEEKIGRKKVIYQFLIGDVNSVGGVCDNCLGFNTENCIVKRYMVVWKKDLSESEKETNV